ncbi:uncharacterized protein PV07_05562 [Cladophialophora immunda]|uniref:Uncharacterized protein n=1 Tax=Cladophialophora immunda TaxID=569365 RepID=A0A0D2D1Z0_9EURO|nr:uncharacterized protein PV07_05562 [Cladophialophora immunda]KIW29774.1 hypothetical protein PV07_05562 [Cladophialophora immunda]
MTKFPRSRSRISTFCYSCCYSGHDHEMGIVLNALPIIPTPLCTRMNTTPTPCLIDSSYRQYIPVMRGSKGVHSASSKHLGVLSLVRASTRLQEEQKVKGPRRLLESQRRPIVIW